MKGRFFRAPIIALIGVIASSGKFQSHADTVVLPNAYVDTPGPGGSTSLFFPGARWQQIYESAEFNAASGDLIRINELRFRIDDRSLVSSFSTVAQGLSIFMSTTTKTFETASSTFSANIGTDLFEALPVSDLPMSGSRMSGTSFDVVIPLPNKYVYDRRAGNLLVEFRNTGGVGVPFLDVEGNLPGAVFSIAGALGELRGAKTEAAYITQFQFDVVPEPNLVALLFLGSMSVWLLGKRRQ
jgi:hypothetical protein